MTKSKTLTGALHNATSPPGSKLHQCKHGKRINACSECYKKELEEKGVRHE